MLLLVSCVCSFGQSAQPWLINRRATATNYTTTATDWYIAATATLTNTLPTVASVRNGQGYVFKNATAGNTLTIRPTGGNTIDGTAGDLTLTDQAEVTLIANGATNWEKTMAFTSAAGTTINPTDGYLPYRSNATTFGDSPWYRIGTNQMGFNSTNRFLFYKLGTGYPDEGVLAIGTDSFDVIDLVGSNDATRSIAIGERAIDTATSAVGSVAVGWEAGGYATLFDSGVAVGQGAGTVNNSYGIVAIGNSAGPLYSGPGSTNDTMVGFAAGNIISGATNTFLGALSGIGVGRTNTSTVSVGASSSFVTQGVTGVRNRSYNTALGTWAGHSTILDVDITNSISIGFNVPTTNSNEIVIGNTSNTKAILPITSYTGSGTLFLSDDGTYKSAGGGGSSPFTNVAGIVQFSPGQAVTNELRVVSGSVDNATNIALRVNTANAWSASGSLLASFGNAGTNVNLTYPEGGILIGRGAQTSFGNLTSETLVGVRDLHYGDPYGNTLLVGVATNGTFLTHLTTYMDSSGLSFTLNHPDAQRFMIQNALVNLTFFDPSVASSGSAVAYLFDTSNTLTNGDKIATFKNAGTLEQFITPTGGIIIGPNAESMNGQAFTPTAALIAYRSRADGDTNNLVFDLVSSSDTSLSQYGNLYGFASVDGATGTNAWSSFVVRAHNAATNTSSWTFEAGAGATSGATPYANAEYNDMTYTADGVAHLLFAPRTNATGSAGAYILGSVNLLGVNDDLFRVRNATTNAWIMNGRGGIENGRGAPSSWAHDLLDGDLIIRDGTLGESQASTLVQYIVSSSGTNVGPYAFSSASSTSAQMSVLYVNPNTGATGNGMVFTAGSTGATTLISLFDTGGNGVMDIQPLHNANSSTAVNYRFDTLNSQTNPVVTVKTDGRTLAEMGLNSSNHGKLSVSGYEAPGTTNYNRLTLSHTGTNGVAQIISEGSGITGIPRDIEFMSNTVTVAKIAMNSGYLGTGTKFLTDDGTYQAGSTAATITYTNVFNYNGRVNYNADVYVTNATIYINNVDVRTVSYGGAASDQTTALTTGTNKLVFRLPTGMTLTSVRANLLTAQASGSTFTVDVNENGTSVLSTKITIDNTEKTSTTAATPPVISDSSLADDSEIEIDIDQVGDGTAIGLKVWLIGTRTP